MSVVVSGPNALLRDDGVGDRPGARDRAVGRDRDAGQQQRRDVGRAVVHGGGDEALGQSVPGGQATGDHGGELRLGRRRRERGQELRSQEDLLDSRDGRVATGDLLRVAGSMLRGREARDDATGDRIGAA